MDPIQQNAVLANVLNNNASSQVIQPNLIGYNPNQYVSNFNNLHMVPPPQQQMNMFLNDWRSSLAELKKCTIKQKFDEKEFVADFFFNFPLDFKNKYLILDTVNDAIKFTAYENSNFMMRNCIPKICIPLSMKIFRHGKELNMPDLTMEKEFTCTCCCMNRPSIKLYDYSNNNNKKLVGAIKSPFSCCSYKFNLFDASDNQIIYIDDTCCQCSLFCPLPCGPCKYSNFNLYDSKTNENVAHLKKEVPFMKLIQPDIDNYIVSFGEIENPEWKMMALAFALFLDYIYFDSNKSKRNVNRGVF